MNLPESLVAAVRNRQAILFAGAGLSCNLGLPLFDVLTAYLDEQLGLRSSRDVEYPILAEYYLLQTQASGERRLFEWMKQTWHPANIDIAASKAHNYILDLDFPIIYTTNYDSWLECAFDARRKPYRKIIAVTDLAETGRHETEIIKFHGDFDDPSSIVLTESSFLRRMALEHPLDIRLRADSLAKPILFVGYSISDPNIRYLLFKLQQLWAQHSEAGRKPNSYVLMVERNELQERLLLGRGVEPIVAEEGDASAGLTSFFRDLVAAARTGSSALQLVRS